MRIAIAETFAGDWISRPAGERLREWILNALQEAERVEIDFSGVVIGSASFFDEGLAKLAEHGWQRSQFDERIVLVAMNRFDRKLLERTLDGRFG